MSPIDILGSLISGGRSGARQAPPSGRQGERPSSRGDGGGLGGSILEDMLRNAAGGRGQSPTRSGRPSKDPLDDLPSDLAAEAQRLEEILGTAAGQATGRSGSDPSPYRPAPVPRQSPARQPAPLPVPKVPEPPVERQKPAQVEMTTDDEAVVLIRALINAAKSDGRIDGHEQQSILSRVGDDPQTIAFLKQEFAAPLDVREFAWSVPLGMEVQVYTMSLAGISIDSPAEFEYLRELAHGLRIRPEICAQIHARYGVKEPG